MIPTVLVTGGAGYIGSHVCKRLSQGGYLPVSYDNLSTGHRWAVQWGPIEIGDLRDRGRLAEVFARRRPVAVIHLAALALVAESVRAPDLYYDTNVFGTLCLLREIVAAGVDAMVFSSTCATYGIPSQLPIPETHPQAPINPYGATKLAVERMLVDFDAAYGLRSIRLRYFNAAGADPDGTIGEVHEPETHALPLLIQTALGQRRRFSILGDDYDTPDGTCIRDYVHVTDLAEAHYLALRRLLDGGAGDAYNLGTGAGTSVRDLVGHVEAAVGKAVPVEVAARRPGDPSTLVCDPRRARRELAWSPRASDPATIISTALAWQRRVMAEEVGGDLVLAGGG